jgi:hypothetical protein
MRVYTFPNRQKNVQSAVTLWNTGLSTSKIASKMNVSRGLIGLYLKSAGINMLSRRYSDYTMNETFFEVIDTPIKAYWLGFLMADGSVGKNHRYVTSELQFRDMNHLELLRQDIEFTGPVSIYQHFDKRTKKTYKSARIMLCSHKLVGSLIAKGWYEFKKQGDLRIFKYIPSHLINHLMRGLFDGDGSIGHIHAHRNHENYQFQIQFVDMHKSVVTWYQDQLIKRVGLRQTKIKQSTKKKAYTFHYGGNLQVERILDFLYRGDGPHMNRKYDRYMELKKLAQSIFIITLERIIGYLTLRSSCVNVNGDG